MSKRYLPYIFLVVLGLILFFIVGFRAGQSVEKTNKEIVALTNMPPTKKPLPTMAPIEYKTFINKDCMISFMYPSYLTIVHQSSKSAELTSPKELLKFTCDAAGHETATPSGSVFITKIHPTTKIKTDFYVDTKLRLLFDRTFEFTSK